MGRKRHDGIKVNNKESGNPQQAGFQDLGKGKRLFPQTVPGSAEAQD